MTCLAEGQEGKAAATLERQGAGVGLGETEGPVRREHGHLLMLDNSRTLTVPRTPSKNLPAYT